MEEALWALLTGSSAVQAVCGQRIFWGEAPDGAPLPYAVLHLVSGADSPHLLGTDGLWRYRVQIDCYGADRPSATALHRAVVALLNGYSTFTGSGLTGCFIDSTRDDTEDAASRRVSRFSSDFNIIWRA